MILEDEQRIRYSVCLVHHLKRDFGKDSFNFYRVADYNPSEDRNELAPVLIQSYAQSLEEVARKPDPLYNPAAKEKYESRNSDFYLLRWQVDPRKPKKRWTWSCYDDISLLDFPEAREVLLLDGMGGESALRQALSDGLPFDGRTTRVFYIAYERDGDCFAAIRCERNDFLFKDGTIKLPTVLSNARSSTLSAPKVLLKSADILESQFSETDFRKVYMRLDELEQEGTVSLRELYYYASDYVKWYVKENSIDISRSEKQDLARIIDSALARPDALEEYLGAGTSVESIASLRKAIATVADAESDPAKKVIRDALLEDATFKKACVKQAMEESDGVLAERRKAVSDAEKELGQLQKKVDTAKAELDSLQGDKENISNEISSLKVELQEVRQNQDAVLEEVGSNLALKLGLRSVALSRHGAASGEVSPMIARGIKVEVEESDEPLWQVVSSNLGCMNVVSVAGDSSKERDKAALSAVSAFAATKVLALPQVVAAQVANALSLAACGSTATEIFIPTGYRNIGGLMQNIASNNASVVMIDNVIDPVNEGVLKALLCQKSETVFVLPFISHESARLVAKEAWDNMFLPSVESLTVCNASSKRRTLKWATNTSVEFSFTGDDVIDSAKFLKDELESLPITDSCAVLAATVLQAAEKLAEEEDVEPLVAQYLAMTIAANEDDMQALIKWTGNDYGLRCIAKALGIYDD